MKHTSGVLFVLAATLCLSSVLGATFRVRTGSDSLNIRAGPNTQSPVIGSLGNNAEFQADCMVAGEMIRGDSGTSNTWYHVQGRNGYVSAAYASNLGTGIPGCGTSAAPAKVNTARGETLNIRSAPTTRSGVVGSLGANEQLNIDCQTSGDMISGQSGTTNMWYHVAGRGYVSGAFVSTSGRSWPGCSNVPTPSSGGDCSAGLRNPRSCSEAVAWAEAHLTNSYNSEYRGLCDHFVGLCYGRSASGFETALIHWQTTPERFRHYDRSPPAGALVFFRTSAFGHACLSTGGGGIISTDWGCPGCLGRTSIDLIESRWGPYLGWTNPYFHND